MRVKSAVVIAMVALVSAMSVSITGQEEALPVVKPKTTPDIVLPPEPELAAGEPTIVLASEPLIEYRTPTLEEAARSNDYVSFDALYTEALKRGDNVTSFATLHELWTYSVTDPIGAFYGPELYARLARAYPGYGAFIADHEIMDGRGNAFYPTSETRRFLLDRALEGTAPRVAIAEVVVPEPRAARASSPPPPPKGAPEARTAPVPIPEPIVIAIAEPVPVAPVAPIVTFVPAAAAPAPDRDAFASRGMLLIVIGLIGIGLLAVILRTPRSEPVRPAAAKPRATMR